MALLPAVVFGPVLIWDAYQWVVPVPAAIGGIMLGAGVTLWAWAGSDDQ